MTSSKRRQSGFTLLELIISMALSVVIMTAMALIFQRNSVSQQELEKSTRLMENAKYALDTLATDFMHAGYLGEQNPKDLSPTYVASVPCATDLASMGYDLTALSIGGSPQLPVFVRGFTPVAANTCLENNDVDTPERNVGITLIRADTDPTVVVTAATNNRVDGNFYVETPRCESDVESIKIINHSTDLVSRNLACTALVEGVRRLVQHTYYLSTCSDCAGTGDGIQALKVSEFINGAYVSSVVSENIERLHLEYGSDSDGDGSVDSYNAHGGVTNWSQVIAVRISVLAKSESKTAGYTDPRTYKMGSDLTFADGHKRVFLSQTVRLHNLGGRMEN